MKLLFSRSHGKPTRRAWLGGSVGAETKEQRYSSIAMTGAAWHELQASCHPD
jgi:hypothetical protein